MKKIITLALALTLLFQGTGFLSAVEASKIYTKQTCTQTNTGRVCKTEEYMKMSTYFSNADAKRIVREYNSWGSTNAQRVKYLVGLFHPALGFATFALDIGYSNFIGYFQTAVKKGTGVEIKYDYVLNKNSHSLNRIENGKVTYR